MAAFLVVAWLLVPQVVQSEKIYSMDDTISLAQGIERLVDATRFGSERSLQSDSFAVFDDDTFLAFVAENELGSLLECLEDSEAFVQGKEGIEASLDTFQDTVTTESRYDEATATYYSKIVYLSEEGRQQLRKACANIGGHFEMMTKDLRCDLVDTATGIGVVSIVSGAANCLADTNACKTGKTFTTFTGEAFKTQIEYQGGICEYVDAEGPVLSPVPVVEEEPEPEPEPEPEGKPARIPF